MNLTDEQKQGVYLRDTNILMSAAAGSGKTGVLTKRVIARMDEGIEINHLLVLTFTRAAAAEMRKRIRDAVTAEMRKAAMSGDDTKAGFWKNQLTLLADAPITTIHSFCMRLLRRHSGLIDKLDSKFRISDEKRSSEMRDRLLKQFLEDRYQRESERDKAFRLVRIFGSRMGDEGLKDVIIRLMNMAGAQDDPVEWLDMVKNRFGDFDYWYSACMELARNDIELMLGESLEDADLIKAKACDAAYDTLALDIDIFKDCLNNLSWDKIADTEFFPRKKNKKPDDDGELDNFIKERRNARKEYYNKGIKPIFARSFKEYTLEISLLADDMGNLINLTKDFLNLYNKEKRKKNILDIGDLETLCCAMLRENPEITAHYKDSFKEVLVDEYQDVNPLQNKIIDLLAGDDRLFTVGDVKQSIYGFRFADHRAFRRLESEYENSDGCRRGKVVYLNKNFRSRRDVLDSVNYVFASLMNSSVSEISYGKNEMLYPPEDAPQVDEEHKTEYVICSPGSSELSSSLLQGRFIGAKIKEIMAIDGFIKDGNGNRRRAQYRDFTVLMRSVTDCKDLAAGIESFGIPVLTPDDSGFLGNREGTLLLSFLQILDNPRQDIPLAAVMRSMMYGFNETELLLISKLLAGDCLWEKLYGFDKADNINTINNRDYFTAELLDKLKLFRDDIVKWRLKAELLPVDELVDEAVESFGFVSVYGQGTNPGLRLRNIALFRKEAAVFSREEGKGLFDFIRYLMHLKETGGDVQKEEISSADAVNIMTIHKSKGLEFPVVFLARTEKQFNKNDKKDKLLINKEYGLGPRYTDFDRRISSRTLPGLLISSAMDRNIIAEELRLLYVAMTRSRDKLFVLASVDDSKNKCVEKKLEEKQSLSRFQKMTLLPGSLIGGCSNIYSMLAYAGCDFKVLRPDDLSRIADNATSSTSSDDFVKIEKNTAEANTDNKNLIYDHTRRDIKQRENYKRLPGRVSVSQLLNIYTAEKTDDESFGKLLDKQDTEFSHNEYGWEEPAFLNPGNAALSADVGTLFHLVMEKLDFKADYDTDSLKSLASEICRIYSFDECLLKEFDSDAVLGFLNSDIGIKLKKSPKVKRELNFGGYFPGNSLWQGFGEGDIMLQGAVDLVFKTREGSWILVDYKTTGYHSIKSGEFLKKYKPQLHLYAMAMDKLYGIHVDEAMFYMTKLKQFVKIEL